MKIKTILLILLATTTFLAQSNAQEEKTVKKIRIETIDESGKKIVIDTTFTGEEDYHIINSDGKNIVIKKGKNSEEMNEFVMKGGDKEYKVLIIDGEGDHKVVEKRISTRDGETVVWHSGDANVQKEMHFISEHGDSMKVKSGKWSDKDGNVVIMNHPDDKIHRVEVVVSSDGMGDVTKKEYHIMRKDGMDEEIANQSKYVFVKDGVTISISGSDETKVKEIVEKVKGSIAAPAPEDKKQAATKKTNKK